MEHGHFHASMAGFQFVGELVENVRWYDGMLADARDETATSREVRPDTT